MPTDINNPMSCDLQAFLQHIHDRSYHPLRSRYGAMNIDAWPISTEVETLISQAVSKQFVECETDFDGFNDRLLLRLTETGRRAIGARKHMGLIDWLHSMLTRMSPE